VGKEEAKMPVASFGAARTASKHYFMRHGLAIYALNAATKLN
jgi:hypothetical protein